LIQKGLNEGRLKFGNKLKPQMQVDSDPLKDASMMYTDIAGCNMVKAIIDVVEDLSIEAEVGTEAGVAGCQIVDITKDADYETALEPRFDGITKELGNKDFRDLVSIAEKERSRITSRCLRMWGTYEWVMMPYGVKNDESTYQKVKEVITSEQNSWNKIIVYLAKDG
jgi:hypothetical protein